MTYANLYRPLSILLICSLCVVCSLGLALPVVAAVNPENWIDPVMYNTENVSGSYVTSWNRGTIETLEIAPSAWPAEFVCSYTANAVSGTPLRITANCYVPANAEMGLAWVIPYVFANFNYDSYVYSISISSSGRYFSFDVDTDLNVTSIRNGTSGFLSKEPLFDDDLVVSVEGGTITLLGKVLGDVESVSFYVQFKADTKWNANNSIVRYTYPEDTNYFELAYSLEASGEPVVDSVTLSASSSAPYYPGTDVQLYTEVSGTGIEPGSPESTVYWYVHGNTSADTYIDNDGLLTIANDETATSLEIEAISTYDATKSATLELPITYPLEGVQIIPSGEQQFVQSDKRRTIQYQLLLPNGDPFDYQLIEWYAKPTPGHENYFRIDDVGLLTIEPDAPAGSGCTIQFAYQSDTSALSPVGASVKIISQLDGIIDGITPTPEQSDKADQMEGAIGDAADKLENNNSSLGQLTPTRPQINTNLEFDQDQMLAVSPLVTNIWSINGLGRMISIVLVVATVAYIFFGKRDG